MRNALLILRLFSVLAVLLVGVSSVAWAVEDAAEFDKQVRIWDRQIAKLEKRITSGHAGSLEERELRTQLRQLADTAAAARETSTKQVRQTRALLDSLGPRPTEDQKSEAESLQKRRSALERDLASYEGQVKQAGLIITKAEQTIAKISSLSRERLKVFLFEQSLSPLSQSAWVIALPEAMQLLKSSFFEVPRSWWAQVKTEPAGTDTVFRNLAITVFVALFAWGLGAWLRKHYGRVQGDLQPSSGRRLFAGLIEGGGRSLGPVVFVALAGILVIDKNLTSEQVNVVVDGVVRNTILFFFGYAIINAGLSVKRHEWRILNFDDDASRLLSFRLKITLFAFLFFETLHMSTSWATPSEELKSIATFLFVVIMVLLLISLMGTRIWGEISSSVDGEVTNTTYPRLRTFLTTGLVLLPVAAIVGYTGFSAYIVSTLMMTGLAIAALLLLRSAGRESLAALLDVRHSFGRQVRSVLALGQEASKRTLFWLDMVVDLGLLLLAVLVLLPIWGFGADDSAASLAKLIRGIQIGSFTFSIVDLFIGILLFVIIIFVTRLIQRGLDRHILPNMTKDRGVHDALKTGVGYIGAVIAFLAAVAVLGLDLTNLALIAGALSVGLGFGLQNVVNNFVSGLILLAERPIKPGDWVVVGGHEGKVKKVNVRSTEVETFQKASVIIPNADLIATPVMNWTHKNVQGRVEVAVGVAYGTDPDRVKQILLDCAKAHPNTLSYPEVSVLFTDFGDSSLNFELRAYLFNVEDRLQTGSDLRFAINKAFKENGIEIPFPQRVVHMVKTSDNT